MGGESLSICRCLKLTPRNAAILGLTDHDHDLTFNSVLYRADGVLTSAVETTPDLSRDGLDMQTVLSSAHLNEDDLSKGVYDGAGFELWMVDWQQKNTGLLLTKGYFGTVQKRGERYSVSLEGPVARLGKKTGRVFQSACDAELGDNRCRVNLDTAKWRGQTQITLAASAALQLPALDSYALGLFVNGHVRFLSGRLTGFRAAIREDVIKNGGVISDFGRARLCSRKRGDRVEVTAGWISGLRPVPVASPMQLISGMPHIPRIGCW